MFLIRMIFVASVTNQRRHFEYHQFSYCLFVMLQTLYQQSVQSDCVFSEKIYHDDTVFLQNAENNYLE